MIEIAHIFNYKKAQSDSGIVVVIFIFLLFCALFLPYVSNSFNTPEEQDKFSPVIDILNENEEATCSYTFLDLILGHETCHEDTSILGNSLTFLENSLTFMQKMGKIIVYMFFWSFGFIPQWLEWTLFVPLRLVFLYLIVRLVRGV